MVHVKHLACIAGIAGVTASVSAGPVFNLNIEFSGPGAGISAPAGSGPWMTVSFADNGTDSVLMTLTNNLTGSEFVDQFLWNVDPGLVPNPEADLMVDWVDDGSSTEPNSIALKDNNPAQGGGYSLFKPDGDGYFDFHFGWLNGVFTGTEVAVFEITGTGVLAAWFDDFSEPKQGGAVGKGPFHAAAHISSIGAGGEDSGWVGDLIPLPSAAGMAFAGLLGLGCVRRRRDL